jgi:hypothetical protein
LLPTSSTLPRETQMMALEIHDTTFPFNEVLNYQTTKKAGNEP